MIYEWREYRAAPGKEAELLARFQDHTFGLFKKHGIHMLGFWMTQNDPNHFLYMCQFESEKQRDKAWSDFQDDPEWQAIKKRSEEGGSLTTSMTSRLLLPLAWRDSVETGSF